MSNTRASFSFLQRIPIWLLLLMNLFLFSACQKSTGDLPPIDGADTKIQSINSNDAFKSAMQLSHQKLVVIDFYADWCGPCRELGPVLEKIARESDPSAQFYKVNIDEQHALAAQNRVAGIPYVVFYKQGKIVHTLRGLWPKESYTRAVERFAFPVTSVPQKETPDGELVDGIRVIRRMPQQKLDDIYVFRGETVKLIFEDLKSAFAVAIPQFQIAREGDQTKALEVNFKADKVGVFSVFCNGDCPGGDGMEFGRIVVMPFKGAKEALYKELNAAEAKAFIDTAEVLILDVRTPTEFYNGHLPGAKLIPVQQLNQRIAEIKTDPSKKILVYCHSGNRSVVASEILIQNGFKEIYHLKNGIIEWGRKGFPLTK